MRVYINVRAKQIRKADARHYSISRKYRQNLEMKNERFWQRCWEQRAFRLIVALKVANIPGQRAFFICKGYLTDFPIPVQSPDHLFRPLLQLPSNVCRGRLIFCVFSRKPCPQCCNRSILWPASPLATGGKAPRSSRAQLRNTTGLGSDRPQPHGVLYMPTTQYPIGHTGTVDT